MLETACLHVHRCMSFVLVPIQATKALPPLRLSPSMNYQQHSHPNIEVQKLFLLTKPLLVPMISASAYIWPWEGRGGRWNKILR